MIRLGISVALILAGFIAAAVLTMRRETEEKKRARYENRDPAKVQTVTWPVPIAALAAVALTLTACFTAVPTGYTGILVTFGKVENRTVNAGPNFILPWQDIVKMDNRTQKVTIETSAFSSDIQQVDLIMTMNYRIDQGTAQELYRNVGTEYYETVIYPRILENTKAVFSQYTAESLIENRNLLSEHISEMMTSDMAPYGIGDITVSVENIDFTDAFTNAVEAKQVAAQHKLEEQTIQEEKTMVEQETANRAVIAAEAEAKQAVIAANAELEVIKIQADAALYAGQKEAETNELIAASINGNLVSYYWIKEWDGKLPGTVLGDSSSYMIDLTR